MDNAVTLAGIGGGFWLAYSISQELNWHFLALPLIGGAVSYWLRQFTKPLLIVAVGIAVIVWFSGR